MHGSRSRLLTCCPCVSPSCSPKASFCQGGDFNGTAVTPIKEACPTSMTTVGRRSTSNRACGKHNLLLVLVAATSHALVLLMPQGWPLHLSGRSMLQSNTRHSMLMQAISHCNGSLLNSLHARSLLTRTAWKQCCYSGPADAPITDRPTEPPHLPLPPVPVTLAAYSPGCRLLLYH